MPSRSKLALARSPTSSPNGGHRETYACPDPTALSKEETDLPPASCGATLVRLQCPRVSQRTFQFWWKIVRARLAPPRSKHHSRSRVPSLVSHARSDAHRRKCTGFFFATS